jgi:hypothetical protein
VTDGTNPIQNAVLNLKINASVYYATTNASGVAVFNPNEGLGTYTLAIAATGYNGLTETLVIGSLTYTHTSVMTAFNITPPSVGTTTGYTVARDSLGNPVGGIYHTLQMVEPRVGTGNSFPLTQTSRQLISANTTGLVTADNLIPNTQYRISRINGPWKTFTTPDSGTFAMPNCYGG